MAIVSAKKHVYVNLIWSIFINFTQTMQTWIFNCNLFQSFMDLNVMKDSHKDLITRNDLQFFNGLYTHHESGMWNQKWKNSLHNQGCFAISIPE